MWMDCSRGSVDATLLDDDTRVCSSRPAVSRLAVFFDAYHMLDFEGRLDTQYHHAISPSGGLHL